MGFCWNKSSQGMGIRFGLGALLGSALVLYIGGLCTALLFWVGIRQFCFKGGGLDNSLYLGASSYQCTQLPVLSPWGLDW